jgi:hypothetical protein
MELSRTTERCGQSKAGRPYGAVVAILFATGCGAQAGEDYPGDPLLEIRGDVVVAALTGGQPVEPALCFRRASDVPRDLTKLSREAAEVFALSPEL